MQADNFIKEAWKEFFPFSIIDEVIEDAEIVKTLKKNVEQKKKKFFVSTCWTAAAEHSINILRARPIWIVECV